mgnify:CR=1 FL=1
MPKQLIETRNVIAINTFCTSPFTLKSPSIGTILHTQRPALKASPKVPSPILMIFSGSLEQGRFIFNQLADAVAVSHSSQTYAERRTKRKVPLTKAIR